MFRRWRTPHPRSRRRLTPPGGTGAGRRPHRQRDAGLVPGRSPGRGHPPV